MPRLHSNACKDFPRKACSPHNAPVYNVWLSPSKALPNPSAPAESGNEALCLSGITFFPGNPESQSLLFPGNNLSLPLQKSLPA